MSRNCAKCDAIYSPLLPSFDVHMPLDALLFVSGKEPVRQRFRRDYSRYDSI